LITVDEETGLVGASKLAGPPFLASRSLINLDSEEWGQIITSCAGSAHIDYKVTGVRAAFAGTPLQLTLANLVSGHTGVTIHEGRANGIKWVVRLLLAAKAENIDFRLVSIKGGTRTNALPSDVTAEIVVADANAFTTVVNKLQAQIVNEYRAVEKKGPALTISPITPSAEPFTLADGLKVLNLLSAIPHGVLQNHLEIAGLVNTSQSLSIVETADDVVTAQVMARSNTTSQIYLLVQDARALAELAGVEVIILLNDITLPWPPALGSKVLDVSKAVYVKLFGGEPVVTGIHAGLECGEIQSRGYDYLEALSIGPDVLGAHTIEEKTSVESCVKLYQLILGIVKAWAE
jgi:dipeptidase D